jgi:hypothetical protein
MLRAYRWGMLRALSRPLAALGDSWSGRFDPGELRVDVEKEVSRIFRYFLEGGSG